MVYFSNSGAEANEGALKLAKYVTKRPAVISFKGSFHGRTMGTAAITGSNSAYRKNYEPMVPSTYFLEYPNLFRSPYTMMGYTVHSNILTSLIPCFHSLLIHRW